MIGPADVGTAERVGMASETSVDNLPGLLLGERKNLGFVALGLDVGLARSVATFATLFVGREPRIDQCLMVRIPVERRVNVRMAGAASD